MRGDYAPNGCPFYENFANSARFFVLPNFSSADPSPLRIPAKLLMPKANRGFARVVSLSNEVEVVPPSAGKLASSMTPYCASSPGWYIQALPVLVLLQVPMTQYNIASKSVHWPPCNQIQLVQCPT